MYPLHRSLLPVLTGLGLSLASCVAQPKNQADTEAPPSAAEQARNHADDNEVSLRFLTIPMIAQALDVELQLTERKPLPVEANANQLSEVYRVPRQTVWRLGKTTEGADGAPTFKVHGQAPAIAAAEQFLLLVRDDKNHADDLAVIPIDSTVGNFSGGHFLFLNATNVELSGKLGEQAFALKPGEHSILKPPSGAQAPVSISSTLFFNDGKLMKPFFSSTWRINPNARSLIIIYEDTENQRLRLQVVRDDLERHPPQDAAKP